MERGELDLLAWAMDKGGGEGRVRAGAGGRDKRGCVCGERGGGGTGVVDMDCNVVAIDVGAVHGVLGGTCVVFVPELDRGGVWAKMGVGAGRGEGAKGPEEVVELCIRVCGGEMLDETGEGGGRRERGRGRRGRVRGEHEGDRRRGGGDGAGLERGKGLFGCKGSRAARGGRGGDLPLSRKRNSMVPATTGLAGSRARCGRNGPHDTKARARSSSVTWAGTLEMYSRGSCRYGCPCGPRPSSIAKSNSLANIHVHQIMIISIHSHGCRLWPLSVSAHPPSQLHSPTKCPCPSGRSNVFKPRDHIVRPPATHISHNVSPKPKQNPRGLCVHNRMVSSMRHWRRRHKLQQQDEREDDLNAAAEHCCECRLPIRSPALSTLLTPGVWLPRSLGS